MLQTLGEVAAPPRALTSEVQNCLTAAGLSADRGVNKLTSDAAGGGLKSVTAFKAVGSGIDRFFNCYLGPANGAADTGLITASVSNRVKALRGHMVTTAVARYAAFSFSGKISYPDQSRAILNLDYSTYAAIRSDAGQAMNAITRADHGYIAELTPRPTMFDIVPNVRDDLALIARLERISQVFDALNASLKPDQRRGADVISEITALAAAPAMTLTQAGTLLDTVGQLLGQVMVTGIFVDDYQHDIRAATRCIYQRDDLGQTTPGRNCAAVGGTVTAATAFIKDKQDWDILLGDACQRLAEISDTPNTCRQPDPAGGRDAAEP